MAKRGVGNTSALVLNVVTLAVGVWAVRYMLTLVLPELLEAGGHAQFLTNILLVVLMVVWLLGIVAHVSQNQRVFELKNHLHAIALTMESVVSGVYWPLRLFFLHQILERGVAPPVDLDLAIHLMPVVLLVAEYWLLMPEWTLGDFEALGLCVGMLVLYWVWLERVLQLLRYPYPFLNVPAQQRFVTYVMVCMYAYGNFLVQKYAYKRVVVPAVEAAVDKVKAE